jgi:hypothetical protein
MDVEGSGCAVSRDLLEYTEENHAVFMFRYQWSVMGQLKC